MKIPFWILITVLSFAVACSGASTPKIALSSMRDGNWEVYIMDTNGSNVTNLSDNPAAADTGPRWSPDGRYLAFTSSGSVVIVNLDGMTMGKFAPEAHLTGNPSWSPDGEYIAFHSTVDGNFEIYTMSYQGTDLTQLTNDPLHDDSCPEWSPDGEFLAFAKMETGFNLYIMRSDGTDVRNAHRAWATNRVDCPLIDWSPDGNYVATISGNLSIHTVEQLDHSQIIAECVTGHPDWSPDGTQIVFAGDECTNEGNRSEIYVVNSDGTNLVRLTTNFSGDYDPVWSPEGMKIAFVSLRDGNREIYVMNADGSQPINLTQNQADDNQPVWQP